MATVPTLLASQESDVVAMQVAGWVAPSDFPKELATGITSVLSATAGVGVDAVAQIEAAAKLQMHAATEPPVPKQNNAMPVKIQKLYAELTEGIADP